MIRSFGVDVREADLDILGPERHEPPAHHVQAALPSSGIEADHRKRVGWRYVPARGNVGGRSMLGIEKTSLISLTSEERRARPHMAGA
jgi:hypothetical protein